MELLIIAIVIYYIFRKKKKKKKDTIRASLNRAYQDLDINQKAREFLERDARQKAKLNKKTVSKKSAKTVKKRPSVSKVQKKANTQNVEKIQKADEVYKDYSIGNQKMEQNTVVNDLLNDPKKAIIFKEILDKPVSLRQFDSF